MSVSFTRSRSVQPEDIDQFGHVNNLVWIRFALELATAHSNERGWDQARYIEAGVVWIVYRHEIDYLRPAFAGDVLEEETWIEALRGARCIRGFRFTQDGHTLVEGRTTWVLTKTATGRACRISPELQRAFPLVAATGGP